MLPNSQTFQLTIAVPFALSSRPDIPWPLSPAWPTILLLTPVTGVASYARLLSAKCSTMSPQRTGDPVQLSSYPNPAALQNYIISKIVQNKNLTFDSNEVLGAQANAVYGFPWINAADLVVNVSVSTNASLLLYTLQTDLVQAVQVSYTSSNNYPVSSKNER